MGNKNSYVYGLILVFVSLLPMSCGRIEDQNDEMKGWPVMLEATAGLQTRISVSGTSVAWEDSDKLKLTAVSVEGESAVAEVSLYEKSDDHNASFSGYVSMTSVPADCYFTYPLGLSTSVYVQNGAVMAYFNIQSGKHEPFLYAHTTYSIDGVSAEMKHIGAMLEITVDIEDVAQLSFVGNRLENLSPMVVDPLTDEVTVSTQSNVQITVPVQSEGKTYIAVPPVNFENGFSIVCSNADGTKNMVKTFSTDGDYASGYDFSSMRGYIIPLTLSGSFENFEISSSDVSIVHTKSATGLLTGTSASFSMTKQGGSDKLVEEWGATLVNSDGVIVRSAAYTNSDPISGQTISMNTDDGWVLLPGGTYTFTPYYKIYGQKISLPSQSVTVSDPGVTMDISGTTSYDKYLAGDIDGANSHTNTMIEGVSVSTNLDLSIISSFVATMDGVDMGSAAITSDNVVMASYGNLTKSAFTSYVMAASLTVGPLTFSAERIFHITGLPMEAIFNSNPSGWTPAWAFISSSYKESRVVFTGTSAIRSPGFYVPGEDLKVVTSCDSRHNVTSNSYSATMSIRACSDQDTQVSSDNNLTFNNNYYQAAGSFGDVGGFDSKGYLSCDVVFVLKPGISSMMYSLNLDTYFLGANTFVSFRHKIEYSN